MKTLLFRRSLRVLVLVAAILAVSMCAPAYKKTTATVQITAQPQGGQYVNTVSCSYTATATDTVAGGSGSEILVQGDFHSSDGEVLANAGDVTLNGQDQQSVTATKSAPIGMYLDKDFWLEIEWTDANGSHTVVSDTAHCH